MAEVLKSVGLDIGTTSTQMIVSELTVENQAAGFAVPELAIAERKILYRSPVHFTPLLDEHRMDAPALGKLIREEYRRAGLRREDVDTGAVIITGETSRKENARAVLEEIADLAGDFVVAAAGPDLESALAAKGSGAESYSARTGKTVLHLDVGGGTSNLALIREGKIAATGCLNVGGRLVKLKKTGEVYYVSPVLAKLTDIRVGEILTRDRGEELCRMLTRALEMAAGLEKPDGLLAALTTGGTAALPLPGTAGENLTLSFSGGVADCIREEKPWLEFGDLGPTLGACIRKSLLCRGEYRVGGDAIRATVIGAGCHSAQLSGSTVYSQNIGFPLKNIPAVPLPDREPALGQRIRQALAMQEGPAVLALTGMQSPGYRQVAALAEEIAAGVREGPVYVCLEADMAKALGQSLALRLGSGRPILCLDRVKLGEGSYLDVAAPVGPAIPVVVKTLVLSAQGQIQNESATFLQAGWRRSSQ